MSQPFKRSTGISEGTADDADMSAPDHLDQKAGQERPQREIFCRHIGEQGIQVVHIILMESCGEGAATPMQRQCGKDVPPHLQF